MTDSGLSLPPAKQRPKTQSVGGAARLSPLELPAGQGLACRTGAEEAFAPCCPAGPCGMKQTLVPASPPSPAPKQVEVEFEGRKEQWMSGGLCSPAGLAGRAGEVAWARHFAAMPQPPWHRAGLATARRSGPPGPQA